MGTTLNIPYPPDASTTAKGVVETSTMSEAIARIDTARYLTPELAPIIRQPNLIVSPMATTANNNQTRTSSGGSVLQLLGWQLQRVSLPTTDTAEACVSWSVAVPTDLQTGFWAREITMGMHIRAGNGPQIANVIRVYFRKALIDATTSPTTGDLALDSFGLIIDSSGTFATGNAHATAYEGGALSAKTEIGAARFGSAGTGYRLVMVKRVNGSVEYYINGSLIYTTAAGYAPSSGDLGVSSFACGVESINSGTAAGTAFFEVTCPYVDISS